MNKQEKEPCVLCGKERYPKLLETVRIHHMRTGFTIRICRWCVYSIVARCSPPGSVDFKRLHDSGLYPEEEQDNGNSPTET